MVNETTLEVYGYVVAADSFGGGYVIPILEAFQSIGASLGPSYSIRIATTVDMAAAKLDDDRCAAGGQVLPSEGGREGYMWIDEVPQTPGFLGKPNSKSLPNSNSLMGIWQPDSGYSSIDK